VWAQADTPETSSIKTHIVTDCHLPRISKYHADTSPAYPPASTFLISDGSASPTDSESHHSPNMCAHRVVSLTAATSVENLRALSEVRDFATTDMGLGGPERWTYRVLQEPGLSAELQRLANPTSTTTPGGSTDAIDFQPCQMHELRTQDRKCVEHWRMPSGGIWVFTAIFDGQFTIFGFLFAR